MRALVIPVAGPLEEIELKGYDDLELLQATVGGMIEAVNVPAFVRGSEQATAYVNEEGKWECEPNMRATDFFVPGVGIFFGDYIAGPLVLCGFNPETGDHTDVPPGVVARARLIEQEAG